MLKLEFFSETGGIGVRNLESSAVLTVKRVEVVPAVSTSNGSLPCSASPPKESPDCHSVRASDDRHLSK